MKSFFRTLIKPDWDDNPKRSEILNAANLLQVGEFQLIQLAYKVWYKDSLPENKINKIFNEYMVNGIIPIWVTFYAKDIIKLSDVGKLNSNEEKYHIYDHEFGEQLIYDQKKRVRRGIQYSLIIFIVFVLTHVMVANYVEEPAGLFPPYIEKSVVYPELSKEKNK